MTVRRPAPVRVVLVEDDHVLRVVLTAYLEGDDRIEVAHAFPDAAGVLAAVAAERPEVVVLDDHLPGTHGIDLVPGLRACAPDSVLVVWSADVGLRQLALARGADAFVPKDAPLQEVVDAALAVRDGTVVRQLFPHAR